jgi:outer membrane protein
MNRTAILPAAILAAGLLAPALAAAYEAGDVIVRVGAHVVDPKSDNGTLAGGTLEVDVDSDIKPTFMAEWMLTDRIGLELLASVPFKHDISLNGVDAGSTKHLPPTLSVQWHFNPRGKAQPYLGAGVNYTLFSSERTTGPLEGTDLDLDNSWGLAAHAGIDFQLSGQWIAGIDLRWIDIDTDASVDGVDVGTVNIDPIAYGAYVGYRF